MPNKFNISFSPIKRRTIQVKAAPPAVNDLNYRERIFHSGLITTQSLTTVFTSIDNPIPSDAPINSSGYVESPSYNLPHVNPLNLKYRVRVISKDDPSQVYWRDLVKLENVGNDSQITLSDGLPSVNLLGSRFDILYPIDDGIRYTSRSSFVSADRLTVHGTFGSQTEFLEDYVKNGNSVHSDFDLVVIRSSDNKVERRTISTLTIAAGSDPVFELSSAFSEGLAVGDTILVKSAKWTGFCNPHFDANPNIELSPLTSITDTFPDALFDGDVIVGDGNATQSNFFDFELTHENGEVEWLGNSVVGQKDSGQVIKSSYTSSPSLSTVSVELKNASYTEGDYTASYISGEIQLTVAGASNPQIQVLQVPEDGEFIDPTLLYNETKNAVTNTPIVFDGTGGVSLRHGGVYSVTVTDTTNPTNTLSFIVRIGLREGTYSVDKGSIGYGSETYTPEPQSSSIFYGPVAVGGVGNSLDIVVTSQPIAPYDAKLTWKGILLGSTNFITEGDAHILTSGTTDASGLHHHDQLYYRKDYIDSIDHWVRDGDDVYQRYSGSVWVGPVGNGNEGVHISNGANQQLTLEGTASSIQPNVSIFLKNASYVPGYYTQIYTEGSLQINTSNFASPQVQVVEIKDWDGTGDPPDPNTLYNETKLGSEVVFSPDDGTGIRHGDVFQVTITDLTTPENYINFKVRMGLGSGTTEADQGKILYNSEIKTPQPQSSNDFYGPVNIGALTGNPPGSSTAKFNSYTLEFKNASGATLPWPSTDPQHQLGDGVIQITNRTGAFSGNLAYSISDVRSQTKESSSGYPIVFDRLDHGTTYRITVKEISTNLTNFFDVTVGYGDGTIVFMNGNGPYPLTYVAKPFTNPGTSVQPPNQTSDIQGFGPVTFEADASYVAGGSSENDYTNPQFQEKINLFTFGVRSGGDLYVESEDSNASMRIVPDLNVTSINITSDQRVKKNISSIENPLGLLSNLNGVSFNYKNQEELPDYLQEKSSYSKEQVYGFIAQDVEQVIPNIVRKNKSLYDFRSIDQNQIIALLVESVKVLKSKVEELEQRVKLENKD